MCGIIGYVGAAQAAPILLEGLRRLEYRGYDSAGIAVCGEGERIEIVKTKGRVSRLEEMTDAGRALAGTAGIGHTRWATHGAPDACNAHPHASANRRVVLVHNGIIENHRALREQLAARGAAFHTQTDTEAAVMLLDEAYAGAEGKSPGERALCAIRAAMLRMTGSFALGILFYDQPGVIYAARRDSPLVVGACTGEARGHVLASDVPAVLGYTREVTYLENMDIAVLTRDRVKIYGVDLEKAARSPVKIRWDAQAAQKGGYAHFMMKEIHEQPQAVRDTLSPRIREAEGGLYAELGESGMKDADLQNVSRVLFTGCGSAYHAGLIGQGAVEALAGIPCRCELASELRSREIPLEEGTLCVVISQSGETADTLAALRLCRERGVKTLAIVNVVASSIAREADAVLYTHAGPEIAVATTKAYAAQLAALYLLSIRLADARGRMDARRRVALLKQLLALPEKIGRIFDEKERIKRLAREIGHRRDVFFIGRGLDYALCMEGSLKLKEVSYIHAQAYAAGELKHGAISLIEAGVPVIAAATQPQTVSKMICAMEEARARGARILLVTTIQDEGLCAAADEVIRLPETEPLFAASLAVVPMQLLAYEAACALGRDADKPRNLAKSVTVE